MNESAFLTAVEQHLAAAFEGSGTADPFQAKAREVAAHLSFSPGAGRFRPRLVEQLGLRLKAPTDAMVSVACSAELIHAASLLHDDVVDDAETRRGVATANVRYGNAVAVLSGDWLLTKAFQPLRNLPPSVTFLALDTVAEMSVSAMRELQYRGQVTRFDDWLQMALGKTGALFSFLGQALAEVADAPRFRSPLSQFGRHLGLAFQLGDDLKDFFDDSSGKPRLQDLALGNPSSVLSLAAERSDALRRLMEDAWKQGSPFDVETLAQEVLDTGAASEVGRRLEESVSAALEVILPLDPDRKLARFFEELSSQSPTYLHKPNRKDAS